MAIKINRCFVSLAGINMVLPRNTPHYALSIQSSGVIQWL
jgi:hypothetical protein